MKSLPKLFTYHFKVLIINTILIQELLHARNKAKNKRKEEVVLTSN